MLLTNRQIDFNYVRNDDDVSKAYTQVTNQTFGYKRLIFDNDFVNEKRKWIYHLFANHCSTMN